jgi:hypothetical protein
MAGQPVKVRAADASGIAPLMSMGKTLQKRRFSLNTMSDLGAEFYRSFYCSFLRAWGSGPQGFNS